MSLISPTRLGGIYNYYGKASMTCCCINQEIYKTMGTWFRSVFLYIGRGKKWKSSTHSAKNVYLWVMGLHVYFLLYFCVCFSIYPISMFDLCDQNKCVGACVCYTISTVHWKKNNYVENQGSWAVLHLFIVAFHKHLNPNGFGFSAWNTKRITLVPLHPEAQNLPGLAASSHSLF